MAYAEKRGKGPRPWRVKYKRPEGSEDCRSGFETKAAALTWGRDQEARIREGRWTDPKDSQITVSEWITRWQRLQDVGPSTTANREYLLKRFIQPDWGNWPLGSLRTEEITDWELRLPTRTGVSRRTAGDARSLLCTILGDAAAARPPLIPYNPALRPRNRGRKTGRRLERSPQKVWATPLETLLVAERATLLSGSSGDFTLVLTLGYTGMRWGEAIGLERQYLRPALINVEWQLREIGGIFHRLPPKDDSYRSEQWEPCLPVDLPLFLANLLSRQVSESPERPCACVNQHGGSGRYIFTAPQGGHHRRSNYARRVFRPACDGRYEPVNGRPGKVVVADASTWPGVPVAAWPPPGPDGSFTPPTGRGIQSIPADTPLACWLPVKAGLTPHGLRHSVKTWMTEDGLPEILAERRLGHEVPGMRGLYAYVSQRMRDELSAALQARWEDSLRQRAKIGPHSPVPLLDELLSPLRRPADHPRWETRPRTISQIPPNKEEDPSAR
jgi:integrase